MPSEASTALRSAKGSAPSTRTLPRSGAISPAISRSSVVFPDPLRPNTPIRASVSRRVSPSSTRFPPSVTLAD